ncbi:MAG: GNAT family N-acetyltransferase [Chloroflexota bacterium]|nr:GNAT family N-acetyltransferase [Chloroflexota bacterium]MDQ5866058.1 GNAT family N-acetyltransferase [Chloroflexota bacterium]
MDKGLVMRPETIHDYAAIAEINVQAFDNRAAEALIVTLLRNRPQFDPELSLVAEIDGRLVGHVLFSPYNIQVLGESVPVVSLAPIAVHPSYQKQGIGGRLIEVGHEVARQKGYKFSFLVGHPTYYPRLGYKVRAYGNWTLKLPTAGDTFASLLANAVSLTMRAPEPQDVSALYNLWSREERLVDFSLDPGTALLDWLSPVRTVETLVFLRDAQVVGYVRVRADKPGDVLVFLASEAEVARAMVAALYNRSEESDLTPEEISLPLHRFSGSTPAFTEFGAPQGHTYDAAMAYPLVPSPFDEYYARTQSGEHPWGRLIWPSIFDIAT